MNTKIKLVATKEPDINVICLDQGTVFQMLSNTERINLMRTDKGFVVVSGKASNSAFGSGDTLTIQQMNTQSWAFVAILGRFES